MTLQYVTTHVEEGLDKRLDYIKKSVKFAGLLESYSNQIQALEDAIHSVYRITIDNAAGVTLDYEGEIVGELRQGREDEPYRLAIKARIQINNSSGTIEDILTALTNFLDRSYEFTEIYPAAFLVRIVDGLDPYNDPDPDLFIALLDDVKPAGVKAYFQYSEDVDLYTFRFASGDVDEANEDDGWENEAQTAGGVWSDMIEGR